MERLELDVSVLLADMGACPFITRIFCDVYYHYVGKPCSERRFCPSRLSTFGPSATFSLHTRCLLLSSLRVRQHRTFLQPSASGSHVVSSEVGLYMIVVTYCPGVSTRAFLIRIANIPFSYISSSH